MPSLSLLTFCPWSTGLNHSPACTWPLNIIYELYSKQMKSGSSVNSLKSSKTKMSLSKSNIQWHGAETFQKHFQWEHDTNNNLKYTEKTVEDTQAQFSLVWLHPEVRGASVQRVHWFSASDQMFYQMIKQNESAAEICVSWVLLTQLNQLHKMIQARDKRCQLPLMLSYCLFTRLYLFAVQVNVIL